MSYPVHPAADCFPMIPASELADLADDIKANGLLHPIELLGNQIIDGRNRLKACELAGVAPQYKEIHTADPISYVVSLNLRRRHMAATQRAAIGAELANLKHGSNQFERKEHAENMETQNCASINKASIADAAKLMNVSPRSIDNARAEMRRNPEAHEAAKRGDKVALKAAREKRKAEQQDTKAAPLPAKPRKLVETAEHLDHPEAPTSARVICFCIKQELKKVRLSDPLALPELEAVLAETTAKIERVKAHLNSQEPSQ